jgi:hypothetical protein
LKRSALEFIEIFDEAAEPVGFVAAALEGTLIGGGSEKSLRSYKHQAFVPRGDCARGAKE